MVFLDIFSVVSSILRLDTGAGLVIVFCGEYVRLPVGSVQHDALLPLVSSIVILIVIIILNM